jgi:hypothetical protein
MQFLASPVHAWLVQPPESDPQFNDAQAAGLAMLTALADLLQRFAVAEAGDTDLQLPAETDLFSLAESFRVLSAAAPTRNFQVNADILEFVDAEFGRLNIPRPEDTSTAYGLIADQLDILAGDVKELNALGWGPTTSSDVQRRQISNRIFSDIARVLRVSNIVALLLQAG